MTVGKTEMKGVLSEGKKNLTGVKGLHVVEARDPSPPTTGRTELIRRTQKITLNTQSVETPVSSRPWKNRLQSERTSTLLP